MVFSIPAAASDFLVTGEKAAVSNTNGYGLNIRSAPTTSSDVHFVASEGTVVDIVSGPEEADGLSWYGVHVDGLDAWVMAQYIDGVASQAGDEVKVVQTNGHGLRLRSEPGSHGETKTVIPEGTVLGVLGDEQTDDSGTSWVHVEYSGTEGYAHRGYLAVVSLAGQATSDDAVSEDPGDSSDSEPPAEPVEAEDPPQNSEPEPVVDDAGQDDATNDEPDEAPAPEPVDEPAEEPAPADTSGIVVGGNVEVFNTGGYGLNVRHGVGFGQSVVTIAAEGHVMQVLGGPEADRDGANWWNVDYRGHNGWVHGDYVRATDSEPTDAGSGSGQSSSGDNSSPAPTTSPVGQQIANQAMQFLGFPYVWGGTTPAGFDCSGFLYYVVNQVVGNNYPRSLEAQVNRGTYVPSDQLQPGDMVFQQNTYQWGLSHSGIYIGNGQFIHASTPGTGVIISNLWDSYWGQRYYTARRVQ